MTALTRLWLPGLLGLCALVTLGLLIWPMESAAPTPPPTAERYRGADHPVRNGGAVSGFGLRLSSTERETAPEALAAAPTLVGLAGHRAYLRHPETGEVEGLAVGQSIGGWRLVSVTARTATVRGAGGDRRLALFAASRDSESASEPAPENRAVPTPQGG